MVKRLNEQALILEKQRLEEMKQFENKYKNCKYICGVDEAGRGPLAGPVVAAAVILDPSKEILFLNDSKKISEKKRDLLYEEIIEKSISYGIGIISNHIIDEINILQATYKAATQAISKLSVKPDILLNDALHIPNININQESIIKGDSKSVSIAAASIIAKVTRDSIMKEYAQIYPEYGFEKHKGYGTKQHLEAIKKYGFIEIHRKTFKVNLDKY